MKRLVYDFITLILNSLQEHVNMYDTYVRVMLIMYGSPYNHPIWLGNCIIFIYAALQGISKHTTNTKKGKHNLIDADLE